VEKIYVPRTAIWVDDDTYLETDLMYLSDELKAQMKPQHWTLADVVVEIVSPSSVNYDRKTKSDTYHAMGVREMWLVDTEKKEVEVQSFESGKNAVYKIGDMLRSAVLLKSEIAVSGLSLPASIE
jgi:Uma2 family endonuclease